MCAGQGFCFGRASLVAEERYLSYLLRLWQTQSEGRWVWRASLESAHEHRRLGFADLEALFDYLREQTAANRGPDDLVEGKEKDEQKRPDPNAQVAE